MPDINIDTTKQPYSQLLSRLQTLRNALAPRVAMLSQLDEAQQKLWLVRDPLMRRTLKLAQSMVELLDIEVDE